MHFPLKFISYWKSMERKNCVMEKNPLWMGQSSHSKGKWEFILFVYQSDVEKFFCWRRKTKENTRRITSFYFLRNHPLKFETFWWAIQVLSSNHFQSNHHNDYTFCLTSNSKAFTESKLNSFLVQDGNISE